MKTYTADQMVKILGDHREWLEGGAGPRADLSGANLSGADLRSANLRSANLSGADLSGANLSGADLRSAKLRSANLSGANLSGANLSGADLSGADLSGADLSGAKLRIADLRSANLSGANLSGANLSGANLSGADLSQSVGLKTAREFLAGFETDQKGLIVYKCIHGSYEPPSSWTIEPGKVLTETVNPDRATECGSGINVASKDWVAQHYPGKAIWRCRIAWRDLPDVVVPFNSDGKFRCGRVRLLDWSDK